MVKPEILSPVGNEEMLKAAVLSGADAVYLGAKEFSARRNAENFDSITLLEAVKYCHIRGVKVYLTLNVILKDSELSSALKTATDAYNAGIDGIIVADLGIAKILKEQLPLLPLHASTQLSVHSPSALKPLKDLGFSRVVVAREMSYEELRQICDEAKKLDMEIEAFVHGALCMCVSGQCLLSAFLGSRSGNRGLCAGPCRLPFEVPGGTGYDLSLKDLSLLEYTEKLREIGVSSFKIEGRMKRPEYVACATAAFRKAVDENIIDTPLSETLKNVFSRSGFTAGYFENKLGKDMFGIRTKEDVLSAKEAFPKIHELYRKERQKVKIRILAEIRADKPMKLTLDDGVNSVTASGDIPQTAKTRGATKEDIEKNLLKLGSTPYYPDLCEIILDENLFIPNSAINELRRNAVALLDEKRATLAQRNQETHLSLSSEINKKPHNQKLYIRIKDKEQLPVNLTGVDGVILPLESDASIKCEVPLIVDIPRGITDEKIIFERLKTFKANGFKAALCGNLAAIELAKQVGLDIIADSSLNTFNSASAQVMKEIGVSKLLLSNEMLISDSEKISAGIPKGIIAYGNIPLMLFKNCPLKNGRDCSACDKKGFITDRKGISFPIRCRMGFSEMLNSVPIWLADRLDELSHLDFLVLYFNDEDKQRVGEIIDAYKKKAEPDTKYTRGLFYRGSI